MLDTVLQIGKTLRSSPDGLKYHRYIKSPTQQNKWEEINFLSLPVREDFSFDFDGIKLITDENIIMNKLHYLTFKSSDADGLVKYFFGDIFYAIKDGKEGGYYRMKDLTNKQKVYRKSSFYRGEDDFSILKEKGKNSKGLLFIEKFRNSFMQNVDLIEKLLSFQAGYVEYLETRHNNTDAQTSDLLKSKDRIEQLNAFRTYKDIKAKRTSNKIFTEKLKLKSTDWEIIETEESELSKLNSFSTSSIFLHFDFNGKHWYEFEDELELINEKLLDEFVEELNGERGFVLKKYLYKTLSSPEKDLQFPGFSSKERYKNKIFSEKKEISDLIYAIDYTKTALVKVPSSNIKIIVLPKGNNLGAEDYDRFLVKEISLNGESEQEEIIKQSNELEINTTVDMLFAQLIKNECKEIIQYDFIFSKQGGLTSPDTDLIELAGIEKSYINFISNRIKGICVSLIKERQTTIKSAKLKPFSIYYSFLNILGDVTKEKKKYQNHLYKVLPQIYSGVYYNDPALLSVFIEKNEQKIRNGDVNYNLLKYDFYFLTKIQNTQIEGENLMKILASPSYKIGLQLGKIAVPLKYAIKSFEKSYVGNLTRRISSLDDLIKFKTFMEEKLILHDKTYTSIKIASLELAENVKYFSGSFDKNECAFGFFESYFKGHTKNQTEIIDEELDDESAN